MKMKPCVFLATVQAPVIRRFRNMRSLRGPYRLLSPLAPGFPLQLCAGRPRRSLALVMTRNWQETLERAIALEAAMEFSCA